PPADPELDTHFQTWGSYGYHYMDEAAAAGRSVLQCSLQALARRIDTRTGGRPAWRAAAVFNPCGFARDAIVSTGRLDLEESNVAHLQVTTAAGAPMPAQLVAGTRGPDGRLVSAEVIFPASRLPSVGYDTFHLTPAAAPATTATDLRIDPPALTLENEFVRVTLDPASGALARLQDRRSGRDFLANAARPFPTLTGEANGDSPLARPAHTPVPPYDTSRTQAQFTWLETGPVRARVRASQPETRGLRFEVTVTLATGSPHVDVQVRVFADMPPKTGEGKINGWQFPHEITEGYWLELTPAFAVATARRDYPFGAEPANREAVTALSWLDLQAADGSGLLLVHGGTQYFKRRENGAWANLVLREWESHFTGEFGWARTSVHRYQLRPHLAALAPAAAAEAALAFDQPVRCVVLPPAPGPWAPQQSFVTVEGATLSALRRAPNRPEVCELRVAESAGQAATVAVSTTLPLKTRRETDALGGTRGPESPLALTAPFTLHPWEIKQFALEK
ncbi:MAG: glycoside hydrolase family 38 C-terminal domain-containing protein, partial [Opitutales bacterium]